MPLTMRSMRLNSASTGKHPPPPRHVRSPTPQENAPVPSSPLALTRTRLLLGDRGCAEISPQSAATAPSYQEFQLAPRVECLKYTRTYPCCEDEPWTQLWIVFHIQRSSNYYILLIEMPSIIITVLSFGQFWMDASAIGARLGFGATMFLTSYVLQSVSGDSLPRCGELLWINYFNVLNLTFCVLVSDRHSNLGTTDLQIG